MPLVNADPDSPNQGRAANGQFQAAGKVPDAFKKQWAKSKGDKDKSKGEGSAPPWKKKK